MRTNEAKPTQHGAEGPPTQPILMRPLRSDLRVTKHFYDGEPFAVIRDPVSSEFTRLPWRDYELASLVMTPTRLRDLPDLWTRSHPQLALEYSEKELLTKAMALNRQLMTQRLCRVSGGRQLVLKRQREEQKAKTRVVKSLTGWMRIYRSLSDPDDFLTWIEPKVRFVFTPWFNLAAAALAVCALILVIMNADRMAMNDGWFSSLTNLALLVATFFGLKVIHEIGHGVACKHYGGEVHEAGFMFLFFMPLLYINTSDAWLFRNKYHRMAVSAAGIYIELLFASLLVPVWLSLQPGVFKDLALNAILIASFSTIVFNANPMLRFDGYYILSDWLEIPNLRQKAMGYIGRLFRIFFLGAKSVEGVPHRVSSRQRRVLAIYAIASFLYMAFLFSFLFGRLDTAMAAIGLRVIAVVLAVMFITATIGLPLARLFKEAREGGQLKGWRGGLRPLLAVAAAAAVLGLIALIPLPKTVQRSCVIELNNADYIRSVADGFVTRVTVNEGDRVEPGQLLVELSNPDIEAEYHSLLFQINQIEARIKLANYHGRPDALASLASDLGQSRSRLAELGSLRESLQLRSAIKGVVVTRDTRDIEGRYFSSGETILTVAPTGAYTVLVPISEREARFVKEGADVRMRVRSNPGQTLDGVIYQEPLASLDRMVPAALSTRRGGDVYTSIGEEGQEKVVEDQWYALVRLDEHPDFLRIGVTGTVRIDCGWQTIGEGVTQNVLDFFKVDYRI